MIWKFNKDDYVKYIDKFSIKPEDLSYEQKRFLLNINKQLSKFEKEMKNEIARLTKSGISKVADPKNWFTDYDLEWSVSFFLNENDSKYDDEVDNILFQLSGTSKSNSLIGFLNDKKNHNKFLNSEHPMSKEKHCYLYRYLYNHTDLGWSNILRIDVIDVSVTIELEKYISGCEGKKLNKKG